MIAAQFQQRAIIKYLIEGIVIVLVMALMGCAQVPQKQAYDYAAASHVKRVVIVNDPDQERYEATMVAHPGLAFGLIGGAIAGADMHTKGTRLTEALVPGQTRLQQRLGDVLSQALGGAGYESTLFVLPKNTRDDDMLMISRTKGPAGDAVLTLRFTGSYIAAGSTSDYFPNLRLRAILADANSGKVLYRTFLSYGQADPATPSVHFASDESYRFSTIDALIADPAKARQGLIAGLETMARQLAADLKRP
jgi:hypothetical protein